MSGHHLIGMDVGTSRVKAVAFDARGEAVATAERPTPWQVRAEGVEADPLVLADVVRTVAAEAAEGLSHVAGIGVTGMGEAGVLTGPDGVPLAPVRAWHDRRADVDVVRRAIGEEAFHRAVGMALDSQPSLTKILRLRTDHPGCAAATRFDSVPEWAVRALGGRPGSELSLASRTGLLDVGTGRAWAAAVDLLGADLLGEPQPAGAPQGTAGGPGVPAVLHGAVLAVGGHDHQCAALAAGAVRDGTLFDSFGTAEALMRFTRGPIAPDVVGALAAERGGVAITVGMTVVRDHLCVMAGLRPGMALEHVAALLGARTRAERAALAEAALPLLDDAQALAGLAAEIVPGGVRLTVASPPIPARVWAAAVRDLVASAQPSIDRVRRAVGPDAAVLATGGWLNDPCVLAAKRRQFPGLTTTAVAEAGAAGAAYLAGVAAGLHPEPAGPEGARRACAAGTWPEESIDPVREVL